MLPVKHCSAGACGQYHAVNDTWALSDEIINDPDPELGGHEMIITGYDDNAVVVDKAGTKHQGVLTLRNSWGSDVADHGEYYMTYDFYKHFVMDAHKLMMITFTQPQA
jgi:C1A family cysteine protease